MPEENLFSEAVGIIPQQKSEGGILFPVVLFPNPDASKTVELTEAIKANKAWVDSVLHNSGAILFRGFPVSSASDFNDVVTSTGYEDLPYGMSGAGARTKVFGRVYTANESPPDQSIAFHHELSHDKECPTKLFFFCEEEPRSGGETCIVLSHVIYEKMNQKHPEFIKQLDEKGLVYIRVHGEEFDPSSPVGRGWKAMFMTSDKSVAEERANKMGMKLKWMEGAVKVVMGPMPSFRYDEARQRKIWFNSLVAAYGGIKDKLNDDPAKAVTFGDGEPLPADIVHDCVKIMDEECTTLQWQKGDVLLIDNLAVLHSRRPLITPPRRILASFCK